MGGLVKEVAVNNVSFRRSSMCSARAIGERDGTFSSLLRPWRDHCYAFFSFSSGRKVHFKYLFQRFRLSLQLTYRLSTRGPMQRAFMPSSKLLLQATLR